MVLFVHALRSYIPVKSIISAEKLLFMYKERSWLVDSLLDTYIVSNASGSNALDSPRLTFQSTIASRPPTTPHLWTVNGPQETALVAKGWLILDATLRGRPESKVALINEVAGSGMWVAIMVNVLLAEWWIGRTRKGVIGQSTTRDMTDEKAELIPKKKGASLSPHKTRRQAESN